jgi:hypothetical protein
LSDPLDTIDEVFSIGDLLRQHQHIHLVVEGDDRSDVVRIKPVDRHDRSLACARREPAIDPDRSMTKATLPVRLLARSGLQPFKETRR